MGIVIRQSAGSILLSFVGIALGYVNLLYLYPAFFTASEVGLTRVIQDFAMLLVPFAQMGTSASIIRFFPKMKDNPKQEETFFGLMLFLAIAGFLLFSVIAWLLKEPLTSIFIERAPEVPTYFPLILILIFILIIHNLLADFTRSHLNIVVPNFLKEILLRVLTTLSIALYVFEYVSFDGFLICVVGAYGLNLLILFFYLVFRTNARLGLNFFPAFSLMDIMPIITYGLFALMGAGAAMIVAKVDTLMVTSMLGTSEAGIYVIAFYMAVVIEIPRRLVTQISSPLISSHLKTDNRKSIDDMYSKSSLNLFIIGFLFFIGIWANLSNIYTFIPNHDLYEAGKWVVVFVGLGKLIDMSFGLNGEIIILSKFYKINIVLTSILAVITIALNAAFIPIFGLTGAAIGTALSLLIFNLIKCAFIWRKFRLQPFGVAHIKVLLVGVLLLVFGLFTPLIYHPIVDLLVRSILIASVYIGFIYWLGVSDEINGTIRRFLARKAL